MFPGDELASKWQNMVKNAKDLRGQSPTCIASSCYLWIWVGSALSLILTPGLNLVTQVPWVSAPSFHSCSLQCWGKTTQALEILAKSGHLVTHIQTEGKHQRYQAYTGSISSLGEGTQWEPRWQRDSFLIWPTTNMTKGQHLSKKKEREK